MENGNGKRSALFDLMAEMARDSDLQKEFLNMDRNGQEDFLKERGLKTEQIDAILSAANLNLRPNLLEAFADEYEYHFMRPGLSC